MYVAARLMPLAAAILLLLPACGDDVAFPSIAQLCAASATDTIGCTCANGVVGTQECFDNGTVGACQCPDAPTTDAGGDGMDMSDAGMPSDASADAAPECVSGDDCASGICEDGVCVPEAEMDPYLYVAVVSTASGDDALDTNTPGPDIDAVQLIKGGTDNFATAVESFAAGEVGFEGNVNDDVALVVGPNDAIPAVDGSEDCNFAEVGDGAEFHSMGGAGGYFVVSFGGGLEVADGDTINVWEIASTSCANVGTVRPDSYNVFIGTVAALDATTSAADISAENGWSLVGASAATGGIFSMTASIPEM